MVLLGDESILLKEIYDFEMPSMNNISSIYFFYILYSSVYYILIILVQRLKKGSSLNF